MCRISIPSIYTTTHLLNVRGTSFKKAGAGERSEGRGRISCSVEQDDCPAQVIKMRLFYFRII